MTTPITLLATGDISPRRDTPEHQFDAVRDVLRSGDITLGQLESVLTREGTGQLWTGYGQRVSGIPEDPAAAAKILVDDGFDVMSFATNHTMDRSELGMAKTMAAVRAAGIGLVGAGMDIEEARTPCVVERADTAFGFLAYCSVTPRGYEALPSRSGVAPARARTFYEQVDWQPATPPKIWTIPYPEDLRAMVEDIERLRPKVDLLVVSMHGGIHFELGTVAMYQHDYSHAAIDAGADAVIWSHGHVAKPIEIYKHKPVFHGVANFSLLPKGPRGEFYDGSKTFDSCRTQIARLVVEEGAITRVSFIPCWIDERLTPQPTPASDPRFAEFVRFMEWSNEFAGLDTKLEVDEDEIIVAL
jgi:poly-gamma-glutamate synthesis protein (capsule biosynthesis protein)